MILVGNSDSLSGMGGLIDAHDNVVRMNGGAPAWGNAADIGTRTTLWSFSTDRPGKYREWRAGFRGVTELRLNGRLDYGFCGGFNGCQSHYAGFMRRYGHPRPSTGLITADYLVRRLGHKLTVVGFDHFQSGTWYRAGSAHGPHDGEREAEYMKSLGVEVL